MTVYLSGPMTGIPQRNFPAFRAATAQLRARGLTVITPHELASSPSLDWATAMRIDLAGLLRSGLDALVLLPGWPASRGARVELALALELGLGAYFYNVDLDTLVDMNFPKEAACPRS